MAKVVQWKFILPYVSKVPEISFLRLSVDVKIRHFGLTQACEENRIPEREGSGRKIFITKLYARLSNCKRHLPVLPVFKTSRANRTWPHVNMVRLLGARATVV